jgi:short subunit fatty acids transporter
MGLMMLIIRVRSHEADDRACAAGRFAQALPWHWGLDGAAAGNAAPVALPAQAPAWARSRA